MTINCGVHGCRCMWAFYLRVSILV